MSAELDPQEIELITRKLASLRRRIAKAARMLTVNE
jgi:hypothetical protein